MTDKVQEIQAASEALADDMQRAAVVATEMATLLQQAHDRVAEIETKSEALFGTAVDRLNSFAAKLADQINRINATGAQYQSALDDAESQVEEALGEFDRAGQAMHASLQAMTSRAEALGSDASQAAASVMQEIQDLADRLAQASDAIAARADEGVRQLNALEAAANGMHDDWTGFVGELDSRLSESMKAVELHLDTTVGNELRDHVESFLSTLDHVANGILHDPLSALQDDMVNQVREEFTALADSAIEAVEAAFKEIIREILGAQERGDVEEQLMRELFEQLRPVFDAIEQQFQIIDGIASAVGIDIR